MKTLAIHQQHSPLGIVRRLLDMICIASMLYVSQWLVGQPFSQQSPITALVTALLFLLIGETTGIYRSDRSRRPDDELIAVGLTWAITLCLLATIAFFTRQGEYFARSSIFGWILVTVAAVGLARMLIRIVLECLNRHGWAVKRCAIAGVNPLGLQLADNIRDNPGCGLSLVGFYDDRDETRWDKVSTQANPLYLGKLEALVAKAQAGEIDTVFVTLPMRAEGRIRWLLNKLADSTINTYIVPDFFVFELLHSRWSSIGGLPAVSVFETPLYGVDGWLKRVFDVVIATLGVVAISPILFTCMVLVKLSSPGPIFFRQKRYGLDGKEIWVWKFRSMRVCDNGPVVKQATKEDPRITSIGKILRKTSLDELPQLFNVLEGTMSLVGPRPHASAHNEHYRKLIRGYMLRHKVRPGITGLAQVEGYRGETETLDKMQKRVDFDHRYIRDWSLWLDLKILIKTFFVVFKQENAY